MKDFLKRADQTITQVRKDNYTELSSYKLRDLRKVSKLPNVFDPCNLLFLSAQIFELESFLQGNLRTEMAKVLFDLHLGFAILFKYEADAWVSQELVLGCSWALDRIIENLAVFIGNPATVNALLQSEMLTELMRCWAGSTESTNKRQIINEVIIKLDKIFTATRKANPDNSPASPPFTKTEALGNMLAGYSALEHGRAFTGLVPRIKLQALLNSQHSHLVAQYGRSYATERQMFHTYFQKTFTPDKDVVISVDAMSTKAAICIQRASDSRSIILDAASFGQGKPNQLRVPAGEEVTIEFPCAINEVKMGGRLRVRNAEDVYYEDYTDLPGADQISAAECYGQHHHAMFVGADGSVMGIGYRASGKGEGMEKLRIIPRPDGCTTKYARVATGKFFRLILTEEGGLFFSGQNKKNMLAKEIELN